MKEFLVNLIKQGRLKFVEPNENLSVSYRDKSQSNFESSKILLKNNKLEEAVSLIYYSMYNLVLSLLYKIGIKSENHSASIFLLKEIFEFDNALILEAKRERIDKQYYVGFKISKKELDESLISGENFNRKLRGFISGMGMNEISNYRKKGEEILAKWKKYFLFL